MKGIRTASLGAALFAAGAVTAIAWVSWAVTSPGVITDVEFHLALLVGGVALTVTLCAVWVGNGHPPVDTRRDAYTRGDNRRDLRDFW